MAEIKEQTAYTVRLTETEYEIISRALYDLAQENGLSLPFRDRVADLWSVWAVANDR